MSAEREIGLPDAVQTTLKLESLIERVVEATVARITATTPRNPFIPSKECARLIEVTPEHLCAMRARGEGPLWSGDGKWIRYERRAVLEWLANLPRRKVEHNDRAPGSGAGSRHDAARRQS
jgi:hypothetical protein